MRDEEVRRNLMLGGAPDVIARSQVLGRELDLPASALIQRLPDAEAARDIARWSAMQQRYPAIGKWAIGSPGSAAAARDDWDSLSRLGKAWRSVRETAAGVGPSLGAGLFTLAKSVEDGIGAVADVADAINPQEAIAGAFSDLMGTYFGYNPRLDQHWSQGQALRQAGRAKRRAGLEGAAAALRPQSTSWVARELLAGVESVPMAAGALLTRDPKAAGAVLGTLTAAGGYQQARDAGADIGTALAYGARQGTVEAITERLPAAKLLGDIAARSPFGKMLLGQLVTEIPGEQAATLLQDLDQWVTLQPDATLADFIASRPDAMRQTLLGTLGAVGTTTGAVRTAQLATDAGSRIAARLTEARRARAEGDALAKAGDAAASSKLRERDPDAFAALMRAMAEDSGNTEVFIDSEAVRAYMQSDDYDPAGPWADYADQAVEAMASGGDVVIPVERVLTDFPGTPAWDKLRDHMRLSAGGQSKAEADLANEELTALAMQLDEEVAAMDARDREDVDGREALVADVTAKLQNAGYMPSAARTQAELVASRYETRAARRGEKLTGKEFAEVDVVQVLPAPLAKALAADAGEARQNDGLDPVIDDMRRGAKGEKSGISLLDFIAKRGGIEDRGGDIASMGGDRWHRSAPFRRKLIKELDAGQASMLGASGPRTTTPERVLQAAIDAGYFPELDGNVADEFSEPVDTRVLLDAISEELGGSARYARVVDSSRADAVAELEQLLSSEGLVPGSATRKEIRAAMAAYSGRAAVGRGYNQPTPPHKDVQAAWKGDNLHGNIDLGALPVVLADYGIKAKQLMFARGKINVVANRHREIDPAIIARLPILIERAWAIYPSTADPSETVVVLSERDSAGDWIIVPIMVTGGVAHIKSIYGKSGPEGSRIDGETIIRRQIADAKAKGLKVWGGVAPARNSELISDIKPERQRKPILGLKGKGKIDGAAEQDPDAVPEPGIDAATDTDSDTDGGRSFDQSREETSPRGRITFPGPDFTGAATIELFQSRNLSTFLHEFGHLTLEELRRDAADAPDNDPLRADWAAVESWFAANGHAIDGGAIPVEAHEMWARAFEGYLLEGKAPNKALQSVFDTLRSWLVNLYRSLRALNTPLNPEIRGVMDRLIATDEDISLAQREQELAPLLDGKGMTGPEFAAYQKLVGEARGRARRALLDKTVRDVRARETRRYRRQRDALLEEIAEDVAVKPAFRAIDALRRTPIDRGWVIDNVGASAAVTFPGGVPPLLKEGGVHPDTIAEQSGFASGFDMVTALVALEEAHRAAREGGDKRGLRERIINDQADALMRERYGEPLSDGAIEREAIAAAHNELQGEVIAAEARVLGRQSGNPATPYAAARAWARTKVRSGRVNREAMPAALQRHARAAKTAAKRAEAAYLARDVEEAFRAKQQQLLASALLAEAQAASEEVETARARLAKWAAKRTMKAVDQDYLEQAHALMEAAEFKKRSQKDLTRQAKWESWSAAREAEGYDIVVPRSFEASLAKENWTRMAVEDFLGLDAAVRQIIHLGRMKKELREGQEKREFEATVAEAVAKVGQLPQREPSDLMEPGVWDAIKSKMLAADAALLKMETVFDWLDIGDSGGVFNRIVFRPLADAQEAERLKLTDLYDQLNAALEAVPAKTLKSCVTVTLYLTPNLARAFEAGTCSSMSPLGFAVNAFGTFAPWER